MGDLYEGQVERFCPEATVQYYLVQLSCLVGNDNACSPSDEPSKSGGVAGACMAERAVVPLKTLVEINTGKRSRIQIQADFPWVIILFGHRSFIRFGLVHAAINTSVS